MLPLAPSTWTVLFCSHLEQSQVEGLQGALWHQELWEGCGSTQYAQGARHCAQPCCALMSQLALWWEGPLPPAMLEDLKFGGKSVESGHKLMEEEHN